MGQAKRIMETRAHALAKGFARLVATEVVAWPMRLIHRQFVRQDEASLICCLLSVQIKSKQNKT